VNQSKLTLAGNNIIQEGP